MATTSERLAGSEQTRGLVTEAARDEALERTLDDSLRRMMESVRPDGIFGSVVEREGVALIPCSEVTTSFGIGGGGGIGPATGAQGRPAAAAGETAGAQPVMSRGSGVGGGGGVRGRPVAVVVVSHGKTRVLPVVDVTKLALATMTTMGFVAFLVGQMVIARPRGRRLGPPGAMTALRFARRALRGPFGRSV